MLARHHQDDMKLPLVLPRLHPGLLHPTTTFHKGVSLENVWSIFRFHVNFQGCRSKWYPSCIFVSQAILAGLGELGSRLGRNSFGQKVGSTCEKSMVSSLVMFYEMYEEDSRCDVFMCSMLICQKYNRRNVSLLLHFTVIYTYVFIGFVHVDPYSSGSTLYNIQVSAVSTAIHGLTCLEKVPNTHITFKTIESSNLINREEVKSHTNWLNYDQMATFAKKCNWNDITEQWRQRGPWWYSSSSSLLEHWGSVLRLQRSFCKNFWLQIVCWNFLMLNSSILGNSTWQKTTATSTKPSKGSFAGNYVTQVSKFGCSQNAEKIHQVS